MTMTMEHDFEGTGTTIQRVRDALAQGVDGGALVRVQGVVGHRGQRRGDEKDGAPVRVQGVAGHRGRRRGKRAGRPHQRTVQGQHTGQAQLRQASARPAVHVLRHRTAPPAR
jgi:hypothetical protein